MTLTMKKIAVMTFIIGSIFSAQSFAGDDVFEDLSNKMRYSNNRQSVISSNLANANTPGYKAQDLSPMDSGGTRMITMATTSPKHISGIGKSSSFRKIQEKKPYEIKPDGNTVSVEQQTVKMSENDLEYRAAAGMLKQMNGLLLTAVTNR